MNPLIDDLDAALKEFGQDAVLRRPVKNGAPIDVAIRATINSYRENELVSGIAQTDSKVIMSPTEIARAGWPGTEAASLTVADPTLPRRNDKLVVDGRVRNIEFVNPITIGGELVRIELRISG